MASKSVFYINDIYLDRMKETYDIGVSIGARYSGKSWAVVGEDVLELMEIPGAVTVAMRKVYASIRDTIYQNYLETLERLGARQGVDYWAKVAPLEIEFANKSKVIFKGMDDPRKTKGIERASKAILEEADEFTREDRDTIQLSLRGQERPIRLEMMFNPFPVTPGSLHWLQEDYLEGKDYKLHKNTIHDDEARGRVCITWTTYKDNRYVPDRVKQVLEGYKATNPDLYRMWTLGEFVEVQGLIFKYDTVPAVPSTAKLLAYGLDHGFSIDPAAVLAVYQSDRDLYLLGLVYSTDLTIPNLSAAMSAAGIEKNAELVPDSARPDSNQELEDLGWSNQWPVKKAPGYKTDMIQVLKGYNLHVVQGSHPGLVKEIATYAWAKNKAGETVIPPKPQDGNDHFMDCLIMVAREKMNKEREMSVPDVDASAIVGAW